MGFDNNNKQALDLDSLQNRKEKGKTQAKETNCLLPGILEIKG